MMDKMGESQNSTVAKHAKRLSNRLAFRSLRYTPTGFLDELRNPGLWNDAVVEMVMCMFLTCTLIWVGVTLLPDLYLVSTTHIGIWAALLTFLLFEGYGPVCGASMSPARTLAYFLAGGFSAARALVYTVAEFTGSAFGAMIAYWLTPPEVKISAIVPGPGVTDGMAMVIEAILSFNIMFVAMVVSDPRKPSLLGSAVVGFSIGTGAMAAGTHTGGLQNPSLAFGPCVASGNFSRYWPYLLGPYFGATVAAVFWMTVNYIRYNYDRNYIQQSPNNDVGHDGSRDVDVSNHRSAEDDERKRRRHIYSLKEDSCTIPSSTNDDSVTSDRLL